MAAQNTATKLPTTKSTTKLLAAAVELGKYGITVNIISPGPIQTGWMSLEVEKLQAENSPLGRIGQPEDVADVVVFLASNQGRWVTGQRLFVGGGNRIV